MNDPAFSVIVPCRNEGPRVIAVLDCLQSQQVSEPGEIVVADGMSDDDTRSLLAAYAERPGLRFPVRIVDNPARHIPGGLNAAVRATRGELVIRVDGHSVVPADYVATMLANLRQPDVEVAGGQVYWVAPGPGLAQRTIPWVLNTRLGNGGTPSRNPLSGRRRVAHTPLSCFRRTVWERIGGYDERLLTNEDFDFDWRAGRHGFRVWSFPTPVYSAIGRGSLRQLWIQRWRYGYWKAQVLRLHPSSLGLRQAVPMAGLPVFVAGMLGACLDHRAALLLAGISVAIAGYLLFLVVASRHATQPSTRLGVSLSEVPGAWAIACIALGITHVIWSAGAWWGLLRPAPSIASGPAQPQP